MKTQILDIELPGQEHIPLLLSERQFQHLREMCKYDGQSLAAALKRTVLSDIRAHREWLAYQADQEQTPKAALRKAKRILKRQEAHGSHPETISITRRKIAELTAAVARSEGAGNVVLAQFV